jgi:hypothetical protein
MLLTQMRSELPRVITTDCRAPRSDQDRGLSWAAHSRVVMREPLVTRQARVSSSASHDGNLNVAHREGDDQECWIKIISRSRLRRASP